MLYICQYCGNPVIEDDHDCSGLRLQKEVATLTPPELRAGIAIQRRHIDRLRAEVEALRAELAKVNNEFGSETADWPDAWLRVSDLKDRERTLWQENESLRAEVEALRKALDTERVTASAAINDLTATQEWLRRHGEHNQHCTVLDLDQEGRHCACSCGFAEAAGFNTGGN